MHFWKDFFRPVPKAEFFHASKSSLWGADPTSHNRDAGHPQIKVLLIPRLKNRDAGHPHPTAINILLEVVADEQA
jgi:hypothetical protein